MEPNDSRFELPDFGVIAVSGEDARTFLGNLLTADVRTVSASSGVFSAWCDARGRVLATLWLLQWDEVFYMVLPQERVQAVLSGLGRYVLRSKVKLEDVTARISVTGLAGDKHRLAACLGGDMPDQPYGCSHPPDGGVCLSIPAVPAVAPGRWLHLQTLPDRPEHSTAGTDYWNWLDVRAGIPWITRLVAGEFIPQMLNLGSLGALCFTKGCYPGQEVIARLHYRGQLKRQLFLASPEPGMTTLPAPGTPLYSVGQSDSAGLVVQAAFDPAGQVNLLVVVKLEEKNQAPIHLAEPGGCLLRFEAGS